MQPTLQHLVLRGCGLGTEDDLPAYFNPTNHRASSSIEASPNNSPNGGTMGTITNTIGSQSPTNTYASNTYASPQTIKSMDGGSPSPTGESTRRLSNRLENNTSSLRSNSITKSGSSPSTQRFLSREIDTTSSVAKYAMNRDRIGFQEVEYGDEISSPRIVFIFIFD